MYPSSGYFGFGLFFEITTLYPCRQGLVITFQSSRAFPFSMLPVTSGAICGSHSDCVHVVVGFVVQVVVGFVVQVCVGVGDVPVTVMYCVLVFVVLPASLDAVSETVYFPAEA